jgi:plastocyanin
MRLARLVIPLAVIAPLGLASGASARDWRVDAVDFAFIPTESRVVVGDSVTWNFTAAGHTSTSVGGQGESWNSAPTGTNAAGTTFTHVFTKPGRYEYICVPHQSLMKGVIEVRANSLGGSIDYLTTKRRGRRVTLTFRLNRAAAVSYRLRGPSRRTVKRDRLGAGPHRLAVRHLKRGRYRGVLTATDASGRASRARNSFRIR